MGKLRGPRVYLAGAMSYVDGTLWRDAITPKLKARGIVVIDPCKKPTDLADEDSGRFHALISQGFFRVVTDEMKIVRAVDIRLITISDFLIVDVDLNTYTVGTWEELTKVNAQEKPIIIRIEQGKNNTPPWLLAMIPHEMIFSTWDEVGRYLNYIDAGGEDDSGRWMFFDF